MTNTETHTETQIFFGGCSHFPWFPFYSQDRTYTHDPFKITNRKYTNPATEITFPAKLCESCLISNEKFAKRGDSSAGPDTILDLLWQIVTLDRVCKPLRLQCLSWYIVPSRFLLKHASSEVNRTQINWIKRFCLLLDLPWNYGFSCGSSNHETACMKNCISCKQRVSRRCA